MTNLSTVPSELSDVSDHFAFGRNWARYLRSVDAARIEQAQQSIMQLLQVSDLQGRTFLDAGSGSGLFSLAAWRLGATVISFDVDRDSVHCTTVLRDQHAKGNDRWEVFQGSLLERPFLESLGQFDVVYCWGVAHHTGSLWQAIENLLPRVAPGGTIVLAIYNDQQYVSRCWRGIKRIYQRLPQFLRPVLVAGIGLTLFLKRFTITMAASVLRAVTLRNPLVPFRNWSREAQPRGMDAWYDLVDWVGGWPFEVARPEEVFRFVRDRGFVLRDLTTSQGHGCNEFLFVRVTAT